MNSVNSRLPIPQSLHAYHFRSAVPDDAMMLNRFLLEIEEIDQRQWVDTLEDRKRDFEAPDTNPETDTILAVTHDNQIAAMGWVFCPPEVDKELYAFLWGEVHPKHRQRGLGEFILSWMESRGREILHGRPENLPAFLRTSTQETLKDRIDLFESHGFVHVRSFYRMKRDLSNPIPEPQHIDKIIIQPWDVTYDEQALDVMNEAFRDHWGFSPMSQELWQLFQTGHPDFRADLSFMAFESIQDKKGKLVGISLNKVNQEENKVLNIKEGWIQELAVLRPWRKHGIATALLHASMQAFKMDGMDFATLGVDTDNLTGALGIYQHVGFSPVKSFYTFSKNA